MNRYNKALTANQTEAHALDVNQHGPQHVRLGFIENYLFDQKRKNLHYVILDELVEVMNQSKPNVLRLVQILERQGRVETVLAGRGDGTKYHCLWIRILKSK